MRKSTVGLDVAAPSLLAFQSAAQLRSRVGLSRQSSKQARGRRAGSLRRCSPDAPLHSGVVVTTRAS